MNHLMLLLLLDSNDYKHREFAHQQLLKDPPAILLALTSLSENKELAIRSKAILKVHNQRVLEWQVGNIKKFPWIAETCQIPEPVVQYYLERARNEIGISGAPDWSHWRLATKFYLLENGMVDLNQLWTNEEDWIKNFGSRYR